MADLNSYSLQYIQIFLFVLFAILLFVGLAYIPRLLGQIMDWIRPSEARPDSENRIASLQQSTEEREKSKKQQGEIIFRQTLW